MGLPVSDGLVSYFKLEDSLSDELQATTLTLKTSESPPADVSSSNTVFGTNHGKVSLQLNSFWIDTSHVFGSSYAVMCWVYMDSQWDSTYSRTPIFGIGVNPGGGEIALSGTGIYTTASPQKAAHNGGCCNYINAGNIAFLPATITSWFHLAFMQHLNEWTIFANGQKLYDNYAFATDKKDSMIGSLKIFRYIEGPWGYATGDVKFLRIYNRMLTEAEVLTIYQTEAALG